MIDSHAHLDSEAFDADREDVLARARSAGVRTVLNIGVDVASSRRSIDLARGEPMVFAVVGIHPQSSTEDSAQDTDEVRTLALENRDHVVAIGEIGLDFHWTEVAREEQALRLERQIELALALSLPVVFHCRDAIGELLGLLGRRRQLPPGVFHCFEGGAAEAERALDLGFHVSFAGNVTYRGAERLRQAAAAVPAERILLETDSPYLPPVPRRGKRNEPSFLAHTRDFLAELKGLDPDELSVRTAASTVQLFGLDRRVKGSPV